MTITRVSVDSAGNQAIDWSNQASISANGRFVAFRSVATNLVPGYANNQGDIFVRDLLTNTSTRVLVDEAGNRANGGFLFSSPSISGDGRFVAFESDASNLVPEDTNNKPDIFVRDLSANTTTRISVSSSGDRANDYSYSPSISGDGRFVAFQSQASNLVPGDTNNTSDIFVRDLLTNTTTLVSVSSSGDRANGGSISPSISADGRFVAFASVASNLVPGDTNNQGDIFVRDLSTNTTTLVSVSSSGDRGNDLSFHNSISGDGRFVAFQSNASNLVLGDTNNSTDIFVRDLSTNTTTLVSVNSAGDRANTYSILPSISADGRFVAFQSEASNLAPGDTKNQTQIFVRDRLTNTTTLLSVDSAGNPGNTPVDPAGNPGGNTRYPSISADGRFVVFDSEATNLVPGDTNNSRDIFLVDLGMRIK